MYKDLTSRLAKGSLQKYGWARLKFVLKRLVIKRCNLKYEIFEVVDKTHTDCKKNEKAFEYLEIFLLYYDEKIIYQ